MPLKEVITAIRAYKMKGPHYRGGTYGDHFGWEMPAPYPEEIVAKFEADINCMIPADLRSYLTEISREISLGFYPYEVCLHIRKGTPAIGTTGNFVHDELLDGNNKDIHVWAGTMKITEDGCTYSNRISITAGQPGSVWACDGNGPDARRITKSFKEYVDSVIAEYIKKLGVE